MRAALALIMMGVFFVFVIYMEIDQDMAALLNERVKNAINRAAHDASLSTQEQQISLGRVIFDQQAATTAFKQTLALNLGLNNTDLSPKPATIFTDKPVIRLLDFVDDSNTVSYPYLYENATYKITKLLYGPSVIAVIEIKKPIFCSISARFNYCKWSVYEYPVPQ